MDENLSAPLQLSARNPRRQRSSGVARTTASRNSRTIDLPVPREIPSRAAAIAARSVAHVENARASERHVSTSGPTVTVIIRARRSSGAVALGGIHRRFSPGVSGTAGRRRSPAADAAADFVPFQARTADQPGVESAPSPSSPDGKSVGVTQRAMARIQRCACSGSETGIQRGLPQIPHRRRPDHRGSARWRCASLAVRPGVRGQFSDDCVGQSVTRLTSTSVFHQ
mgnify:CR=1 FL=1